MNSKTKKIIIILVSILVVGSLVFMFTISPISLKKGNREMPEATSQTGELLSGVVIEQKFKNITEDINEIAIVFSRQYSIGEKIDVVIELLDGDNIIASDAFNADDIRGDHRTYVKPCEPLNGYVGKELTLKIYTTSTAGTGLSLMMNDKENSTFKYGNNIVSGTLCFSITGIDK